jgi:hypothetical protein
VTKRDKALVADIVQGIRAAMTDGDENVLPTLAVAIDGYLDEFGEDAEGGEALPEMLRLLQQPADG